MESSKNNQGCDPETHVSGRSRLRIWQMGTGLDQITTMELRPGIWKCFHSVSIRRSQVESWFVHMDRFKTMQTKDVQEWCTISIPSDEIAAVIERKPFQACTSLSIPIFESTCTFPRTRFRVSQFVCPDDCRIYAIRFIPLQNNMKSKL